MSDFLFELALQIKDRLPANLAILKKISALNPANMLGSRDSRDLSVLAASISTLRATPIDISAVEAEWRLLKHTPVGATSTTPLLQFWTAVARYKCGADPVFPNLTRLASSMFVLPISNASVERLFSVMGVVKNKLRNVLAMPMVDAILAVRYGLVRRGETCDNFEVLPAMLSRFNQSMYDHKRVQAEAPSQAQASAQAPAASQGDGRGEGEEDEEMLEILRDVEELFGEPIFLVD